MTRSRRAAVRQTPSSLSTVTVSDFVRGALYDIDKPTVVMTHGEPVGMWIPRGQYETLVGTSGFYYGSSNLVATTMASTPPMANNVLIGSTSTPPVPDNIRAAVAQLHSYLNPEEGSDGEEEGS